MGSSIPLMFSSDQLLRDTAALNGLTTVINKALLVPVS